MKSSVILIYILHVFVDLRGQSVKEFVNMAKQYSPDLKALHMDYEAALMKVDQVNEWPDPVVNIGLGILPVETRLGAQRFRVGVQQMIPWKGSLQAKSNLERSKAEVKSKLDLVAEIDIEYSINTAYQALQFLAGKQKIINRKLEVLDALEALAKSALRSGKGKLSNVLLTERSKNTLEFDIDLIQKRKEPHTIMINKLVGRSLYTEVVLDEQLDSTRIKEVLIKYAEEEHPQYGVFQDYISLADSKIELTKYVGKPQLGVGLEYGLITERKDVELINNGRDVLMPMGKISLPLHRQKYDAMVEEALLNKAAIRERESLLRDKLVAEIEGAFSSIELAKQEMEKYESLKKITKETLKLLRMEFATEGTRFEELLRIEMELVNYDMQILQARFARNLAFATLDKFK